jgi:hypothetical protein
VDQLGSAVFSADGQKIIKASLDGIIRIWGTAVTLKEFLRGSNIETLTSRSEERIWYRIEIH